MERDRIREQVRAVLAERLGAEAPPAGNQRPAPAALVSWRRFDDPRDAAPRALLTQADVLKARGSKTVDVPPGAIVTPLARETADRLGIALAPGGAPAATVAAPAPAPRAESGPAVPAARSVVLAADHGGFVLKEALKPFVAGLGFAVNDLGTTSADPVDYPDFAHRVAEAVAGGRAAFGIMVDGVGVGSAMAANRHKGIRAAPCSTTLQAQSAREHNDANVLTLGGRHLGEDVAKAVAKAFLETPFAGGRHAPRVRKIDAAGGAS
jgi:ribose 5-phosphate isomerase B